MDFVGSHIISVDQFDREAADRVFAVADRMRPYANRQ
ncbi:MAG: aspartate carbamoyltransferase, partial [Pseudomonadota bacterium]|nr:aspartate carbamoyltransferase [Pseudomonadota bacterium]